MGTSFLSTADAARVLAVTPATVRLIARRGELPVAARTEGGMQLFDRRAVERLARRRQEQGRAGRNRSRSGRPGSGAQ